MRTEEESAHMPALMHTFLLSRPGWLLFTCLYAPDSQVRMTQEVANFFVSEARRNMHRANSINEEDDLLVYNWIPHFTGEWTLTP